MTNFVCGIKDNDAKGLLGGTQYYLEEFFNGKSVNKYFYTTYDLVLNTPHMQFLNKLQEDAKLKRKEGDTKKQTQVGKTVQELSPKYKEIVDSVCKDNQKIYESFINGNEKSINALIGKSLKLMPLVDPASIKDYLSSILTLE